MGVAIYYVEKPVPHTSSNIVRYYQLGTYLVAKLALVSAHLVPSFFSISIYLSITKEMALAI